MTIADITTLDDCDVQAVVAIDLIRLAYAKLSFININYHQQFVYSLQPPGSHSVLNAYQFQFTMLL